MVPALAADQVVAEMDVDVVSVGYKLKQANTLGNHFGPNAVSGKNQEMQGIRLQVIGHISSEKRSGKLGV